MHAPLWRVGDVARRTGLSIRTLHYYDEIGLLSPSHRSGARYLLYTAEDIARLQIIRSLQQMGFALGNIRSRLDCSDLSPARVIECHIARLREQIASQRALCERLETIAAGVRTAGEAPIEEVMRAIEMMEASE